MRLGMSLSVCYIKLNIIDNGNLNNISLCFRISWYLKSCLLFSFLLSLRFLSGILQTLSLWSHKCNKLSDKISYGGLTLKWNCPELFPCSYFTLTTELVFPIMYVCFFKNRAMVLFNKDSFKGDNWQFVFSLYLSLYMFGSISIIMHAF